MPFIINNIDALLTIASATLKALKFIGKCLHYAALALGAVLILTGYWLVTTANHFAGKTQTATESVEAVHGPVVAEYAPAPTVTPESYVKFASASYALNHTDDWVLEDAIAPIVPTKPSRKRQGKNATPVAA